MSLPAKPAFLTLAVLTAALSMAAESVSAQPVPGRYIVAFKDRVPDPGATARGLAAQHGLRLGFVYQHAVKGFSFAGPEAAAQALARNPLVARVEPDLIAQGFGQTLPTGVNRIDAEFAAASGVDQVDIAIIDTGIDLDHPDLNVVGSTNCLPDRPSAVAICDGRRRQRPWNPRGRHRRGLQ